LKSGMVRINRLIKIASALLVGAGVLFLILNITSGGKINFALPFVFLMLGAAFYILVFILSQQWNWAVLLFIPGSILFALGIIFLLNVITNDWNSWAYAWLLIVAGAGLGAVLAGWYGQWRQEILYAGVGLIVLGITFFFVFGVIAGGLLMQIMAPLLLVLGGLTLRWLPLDSLLPESVRRRLGISEIKPAVSISNPPASPLIEPLSNRELEVLRLIDAGLSNQEIALQLVIAPSTIKTHINNIYGKMNVQTRLQAVKRAKELGLINESVL
jgi:DNA-binding CsgD family transcriptional regulator